MSQALNHRSRLLSRSRKGGVGVLACCAILLLFAACDYDPMERPHTWSLPPAGLTSNEENLRTMLVNPNDLVAGTGDDSSVGVMAAHPITRLYTGHRTALPAQTGTEIPAAATPPQGGGQGGQGGPGPQ